MENQFLEQKFKDVPLDEDTVILHFHFGKIGEFDVKFEFWTWSGYGGVSAIFLKEDVKHLSEEEISALVKTACNTKSVEVKWPGKKYLFATYAVEDYSA